IANPLHLLRVQDVMEPPVLQVGARPPAVSYPDELLDHALTKMLEHEVDLLPVVNRGEPEQVVGYVARDGILAAWCSSLVTRGGASRAGSRRNSAKCATARRVSGSPPLWPPRCRRGGTSDTSSSCRAGSA